MFLSGKVPNAMKLAVGFPIYQLSNLIAYCRLQRTAAAKMGMFLTFLPVMAVNWTIWAAAWAVPIWALINVADYYNSN